MAYKFKADPTHTNIGYTCTHLFVSVLVIMVSLVQVYIKPIIGLPNAIYYICYSFSFTIPLGPTKYNV